MKKKLIICIIVSLPFLISCKKDAELVTKEYPVIETQAVSVIDSDGVTFHGEFVDIGLSPITEYGFVFSTFEPSIENSDTLIIASDATGGAFSKSTSENIAGNILYNVKAFAKTDNHVIYGNNVEFLSKGSKFNPWDLVLQPDINGWHDTHGTSGKGLGFILFQSNDFYSYNPNTNTVTKKQNIPISGNTGTYFASFNLDNYLYILTNACQQVLRYDIENDQWTKLGNRPFSPGWDGEFLGFTINNTGYFLSRNNFYSYNQSDDTWSKMADIPSGNIHPAGVVNNKVYVLGDYRFIYSYNSEDNTWKKETQYPGEWKGKILSFTQNDKIYWGLSYTGGYVGAPPPATDMWEYNPVMHKWKKVENFPIFHSQTETYTFSVNGYSYFGHQNSNLGYVLFRFDSKKIK